MPLENSLYYSLWRLDRDEEPHISVKTVTDTGFQPENATEQGNRAAFGSNRNQIGSDTGQLRIAYNDLQ